MFTIYSSRERERERERAGETEPDGRPAYNRFGSPGSIFERYKRDPDGRDMGGEVRKKIIAWDVAPEKETFDEIFRVSRQQIIWGGNYFLDHLGATECMIFWDKCREGLQFADGEIAWTSFRQPTRRYTFKWNGMLQGDMKNKEDRFHPTQKPVALYRWIFAKYAKPGDKILDTHLGSGSSRIAAWDAGLDFVGYEIDKFYFEKQEERFERHAAQINLFL